MITLKRILKGQGQRMWFRTESSGGLMSLQVFIKGMEFIV